MSNEIISYVPKGMIEIKEFCAMVAKSNIVPKEYIGKPENVFVACLKGMDLGLKPLQALECIAVINGKTSLYGDAYLAIARGSGKLESYNEAVLGEGNKMKAVVTVKRRGEPEVTCEYSVDDAETAGLWNKVGPWKQHPKRMLLMKARNYVLRAAFADLFLGLEYSAEELQEVAETKKPEIIAGEPKDITPSLQMKDVTLSPASPQSFAVYSIGNETFTSEELEKLIWSKIDAINDNHSLTLFEMWRDQYIDTFRAFRNFNPNVIDIIKQAIETKKEEFGDDAK